MKRLLSHLTCACLLVTAAVAAGNKGVRFARGNHTVTIRVNGDEFSTYHFDPSVAKAFLMPLRTAQGVVITRDFPEANEVPEAHRHDDSVEPHQRPMYFGHSINGYDFWGEEAFLAYYSAADRAQKYGRMVFHRIERLAGGTDSGTLRAAFDLVGPDKHPFAEEVQQFTFSGDNDTRLIDTDIWIRANRGTEVKMADTKEGTFAIRVRQELNSPPARMVSSTGGVGEPQIWGKRADWVDYSGSVEGHTVGVAIFDSPRSFRHPTWWHARGYGLFAANPFGWSYFMRDKSKDGSYTIDAGKDMHLRYRVVIHNGDVDQAHIADLYKRYASRE